MPRHQEFIEKSGFSNDPLEEQENQLNKRSLPNALEYIKSDRDINEVILSGGDPLMAKDDAISWFMDELEQLPHAYS